MIMCCLYHTQTFILTKYVYACVLKILNTPSGPIYKRKLTFLDTLNNVYKKLIRVTIHWNLRCVYDMVLQM